MPVAFDPDDGLHVSSYPFRGNIWRRSHAQRHALFAKRDVFPVAGYVLAAVTVQRYWRGVLLRRRVLRHYVHGGYVRPWRLDEGAVREGYRIVRKAPEADLQAAASLVQARWRTTLLRQEFARWSAYDTWPIYYVSAATIQRAWVDYCYVRRQKRLRHRAKRMFASRDDAMAGRIQLAWRGYVNRQIFAFYRRLVLFRQGADATAMLRAINPSEAHMMDPAAGLHVRFRLTGASFPPIVVYKIYTHRNVADVGAFAPKDYTVQRTRQEPREVHCKPTVGSTKAVAATLAKTSIAKDRSRWYKREENNEWRAVSETVFATRDAAAALPEGVLSVWEQHFSRFLSARPAAPGAPASSLKQPWRQTAYSSTVQRRHFHALPQQRRAARQQRSKETKRRWLVELYAAEQEPHMSKVMEVVGGGGGGASHHRRRAQGQGNDLELEPPSPRETVRANAASLFATLTDEEVDDETRRLMEWTEHLDFDTYHSSWQCTATTASTAPHPTGSVSSGSAARVA